MSNVDVHFDLEESQISVTQSLWRLHIAQAKSMSLYFLAYEIREEITVSTI